MSQIYLVPSEVHQSNILQNICTQLHVYTYTQAINMYIYLKVFCSSLPFLWLSQCGDPLGQLPCAWVCPFEINRGGSTLGVRICEATKKYPIFVRFSSHTASSFLHLSLRKPCFVIFISGSSLFFINFPLRDCSLQFK